MPRSGYAGGERGVGHATERLTSPPSKSWPDVEAIATSSPRLEALILGFGDLPGSMGMRFGHELDKDYRYPGDM